jgi:membrane-associated phospholipid phosphatase
MALSRTILAVHWITDTLGGALVGVSAALIVGAFVGIAGGALAEIVVDRDVLPD